MKSMLISAIIGVSLLASCNQNQPPVGGTAREVTFAKQGMTDPAADGRARIVRLSDGTTATTLTLSGLTPNTQYVAHYHSQGQASTNPCQSNGPIVGGTIGAPVTTDAQGRATMRDLDETATIESGTYINVHLAASLSTIPLCADLR